MPSVPVDELQGFARRAAGDRHDAYSEAALVQAYDEYRASRSPPLAPLEISVAGRHYDTLYAALADPGATFWDAELTVVNPPPAGPAWEWTFPFRSIRFSSDGSAEVQPVDGGAPVRAIGRLMRRDYYVPRTAKAAETSRPDSGPDPRPGLLPLGPSIQLLRKAGFVPFSVAVLLYTADGRHRYEIDLLDTALLRDARAGQLPIQRRVRRTSRVAFDVDSFVARGELAVRTARVLEMLVESHGLTPIEVSQIFGGVREFGISALRTLQSRGLATLDRQTGIYRPRFEPFRAARRWPESTGLLPNPALRTSVAELLAAADSRATCPLCGDPLPPGPHGILCDRCEAEVGAAGASPP
ncbi:MAG TPA: hypothetical protein VEY07_05815 [Thermoplasmata archaeon]|nr:hypothetical protein [Thermoplasmata archaeon]